MSEAARGANRYAKIRDLNSGSFGFVELAKDEVTGKEVAIKYIERGEKINKHVRNEIKNHRNLLHHHVIKFKEVFLKPEYLCIVMEYAPGGDVLEYVKKKNGLSEDEARWFFQQLVIGLDYCHKMGVANRDIKLENTLLDASPWPLLKICDFGYSKHETYNSAPGSRVGTPAYLAPEVIMNRPGKHYDGKTADIWSCGVFLFVMMVGAYPFERPEDRKARDKLKRMINRICAVEYSFPGHIRMSDECRELITLLLCKEPEKRIKMADIMQHPWFRRNLPDGAETMNASIQQQNDGLQSPELIDKILEEAKNKETIRDIDATIDDEFDKLSNSSA